MLRQEEVRAALVEAVAGCDRLVLLGDTVELRHGPLRAALQAAEPVLRELGQALGPGGEALMLIGNHDHRLLRGWFERRAAAPAPAPLGLEETVDVRPDEPLATVAGWLAPARVRVSYPGVWLREDVYATHGHYSDRHYTVPIIERLGAALMTRVVAEPEGGPRRVEDYEATLAPMYAWIDSVAQSGGVRGRGSGGLQVRAWRALQRPGGGRTLRGVGLAAAWAALIGALNRAELGPFERDVTAPALRRAGLAAFAEVLERLGVGAPYVIFGHTHRPGPLDGDPPSEWRVGSTSLLNTGSWTYDRAFVGDWDRENPYRPGFCVTLEDSGPPRVLNLLDARVPVLA